MTQDLYVNKSKNFWYTCLTLSRNYYILCMNSFDELPLSFNLACSNIFITEFTFILGKNVLPNRRMTINESVRIVPQINTITTIEVPKHIYIYIYMYYRPKKSSDVCLTNAANNVIGFFFPIVQKL